MKTSEYPDGGTPGPIHTSIGQPAPLPHTGASSIGLETGAGLLAIVLGCVALIAIARAGKKR